MISDAFGAFTATGNKFINTTLLVFCLIGIQAILDSNFVCPSDKYNAVLAGFYSLSFYLCPAIVFLYLGLYYFPGFNKKRFCPCWSGNWACMYVVLEIGKAPVMWLLIAMTDGRYLSCFIVATSNYKLDHDLYLFIFQTTGMLAITLLIITLYYISMCTCPCITESRRAYQMLADVEGILEEDEILKQRNTEKQKFLCALERNGEYMDRTLPKYMRDKEHVISAGLNPPPAGHH
ncbi:uncharacterized protein ACMZJ9_012154 [Mantella aurantiaca]